MEKLPGELLNMIVGSLDNVSKSCLASTNSRMRGWVMIDRSTFSTCQKWLLMCLWEKDVTCRFPPEYACCFCKTKHPRDQFVASDNDQVWKCRQIDAGRVKGNPVELYCWRYKVRTSWEDKDSYSRSEKTRWVQKMRLTCLHCREEVPLTDERITGCAKCCCDTCPRARLPIYVRYGPPAKRWLAPNVMTLLRMSARELWIEESGRKHPGSMNRLSRTDRVPIGLMPIPVEYED